jgi:hypothetical protein
MPVHAISLLWGILALGPPVQRPSPSPVESASVEPAPVEPALPEPEQLPRYDAPVVVEPPAPSKPTVDGEIVATVAIGSVLLSGGTVMTLMTLLEWKSDSSITFIFHPDLPPILIGVGAVFIATGATLIGVGAVKHRRWKNSQNNGTARVQLQPTIGFGQLGVVGRF